MQILHTEFDLLCVVRIVRRTDIVFKRKQTLSEKEFRMAYTDTNSATSFNAVVKAALGSFAAVANYFVDATMSLSEAQARTEQIRIMRNLSLIHI